MILLHQLVTAIAVVFSAALAFFAIALLGALLAILIAETVFLLEEFFRREH